MTTAASSQPLGQGITTTNMADVKAVFDLVKAATSRNVVRNFLKSKNLKFSAGSWEQLYTARIETAINDGSLTIAELHNLLRTTEGFGNQHIFLFKCDPGRAKAMLADQRINTVLSSLGIQQLAFSPLTLDLPTQPTLVDVHKGQIDGKDYLFIKEIETRTKTVLSSTATDPATGIVTKQYAPELERAINIARLFDDGTLEIRIASKDSSTKYAADVARFRNAIGKFILPDEFAPYSIQKAKDKLIENKDQLKDKIRYSDYTLQNEYGTSLKASVALISEDLTDDEAAINSLNAFRDKQTFCTSSNIFFRIFDKDSKKERGIHVLLSGEVNEFTLTAAANAEDYEYVLSQIQQYNK